MFIVSLNYVYSLDPKISWIANGEEAKVNCLHYSQDGKYLFVHSTEREKGTQKFILRQWDIANKAIIKEIPTKLEFLIMDVSSDMKTVIGTDVSDVEFVDFENSSSIYLMIKYGSMFSLISWLSFSSDDSKIFVLEYFNKNIQIFDSKTLESIGEYVYNDIHRISSSFDKNYAGIVHKSDTTFSVIKLDDNAIVNKFKIGISGYGAENSCFSFDNNLVVINYDSTGYSNNTEVYEIATGKLVAKTSSNLKSPSTAFTKDNETIAISDYPFSKLLLWNYKSNEKIVLEDFILNGANLATSPKDNTLVSTTDENHFVIADYIKNELLLQYSKDMTNLRRASNIYISKDSKFILAAGSIKNKGVIQKRDFLTGNILDTYILINEPIINMFVSEDEKLISIIDYYWTLYLLKLVDNKYVVYKQFPHEAGRPLQSLITKDNKKIIYAGVNTGIICYNLETNEKKVFDTTGILFKSIALSSDNSKIIFGTYESYFGVLEYNQDNDEYYRKYYTQLEKQLIGNSGISEVGFSPDNSIIYACAGDYRTYLLNSVDYTSIKSLKSVNGWKSSGVTTANITIDNDKLIVFDSYSSGRIFDLKSNSELWYDDSLGSHNGVDFNIVHSVELSTDNKYFLLSYYEGTVALVALNDSTTSVEDLKISNDILIYPNPANDYIEISSFSHTLKHGFEVDSCIQIINTYGEIVLSVNLLTSKGQMIDVSKLSSGIYFIKKGNRLEKFVKL
jgi:hypothetical protein